MYNRLVLNLTPSAVRYETLDGEEHAVVPTAMLLEGVHEGSNGPILYQNEDMRPTVSLWDHRPVVVYHPVLNSQGVSACDPVVLNKQRIGITLNTRLDDKLRTDVWINVKKADSVDKRIMEAVRNNQMMEVSTGLFLDCEGGSGEWGPEKVKYNGVAKNQKPDHLAILPDKIGACSIAKGAGMLQVNEGKVNPLSLNELSFDDKSYAVRMALYAKYNKPGYDWSGWVVDVFGSFVIYRMDGKFYQLNYTSANDVVTLTGDPVEVVRVTEYRKVSDGSYVGNSAGEFVSNQEKRAMAFDKTAHLNGLVGNGFEEKDRDWLSKLPDDQLQKITPRMQNPAPGVTGNATPVVPPVPPVVVPPVTPPTPPKVMTVNEYIANAPPEVAGFLNAGMAYQTARKAELIKTITANASNRFTPDYLNSVQDLNVLEGMAVLAAGSQPQAGGATTVLLPAFGITPPLPTNNAKPHEETPLSVPRINWAGTTQKPSDAK